MHLAIHNWMRAEPIEKTVARISAQGYDALEIEGAPERYDTKYVRELLRSHGLRCWGTVTLMMEDRNLLARDEAQRAATVRYVLDLITMVKELEGVNRIDVELLECRVEFEQTGEHYLC